MDKLKFDSQKFVKQTLPTSQGTLAYRQACDITYVTSPVDPIQKLNIFVPEAYFNNQVVNGYTQATAPIFMPNTVGGYMPGPSDTPTNETWPTNARTIRAALTRGYVVVSAGLRGWPLKNSAGKFVGKAPAFILDMKAAIRYVKFNAGRFPGDSKHIITNGTSAGGATSALAGASGNAAYFESALAQLGAAPATDDIFAVSAYCPIHNLEHADMAYEWEFNGINDWYRQKVTGPLDHPVFTPWSGTLTATEQQLSRELKQQFISYLNHLNLVDQAGQTLTLAADGTGSFATLVQQLIIASAQRALDQGQDIHKYAGLTVTAGKVTAIDWPAYLKSLTRMKSVPAFDTLDLSSPETNLFGDEETPAKHFTTLAQAHTTKPATLADSEVVAAINPVTYLTKHTNAQVARHWRIRHGAADRDTSFAIPVILATLLRQRGSQVDFALPWDTPHSGDYDVPELFDWIDQLCQ